MSTVQRQTTTVTKEADALDRAIEFTVYGTKEVITLTMQEVRTLIANPTKSGKLPSQRDIAIFLKTCKARGLNPYQKDVFLLGYDTKDGPKFETVVALPAMLKRAEGNSAYEGKEYGVLVSGSDGTIQEVAGDVVSAKANIVGGWCRVYRAGRRPEFATANLKAYDKQYGHWSVDKPWMIAKCAIAKALRQAFPSDVGDLTIQEELGAQEAAETRPMRLTDRLASIVRETEERQQQKPPEVEPQSEDDIDEEESIRLQELWEEFSGALDAAEKPGDLSFIDEHILPRFPAEDRARAKEMVDNAEIRMAARRAKG